MLEFVNWDGRRVSLRADDISGFIDVDWVEELSPLDEDDDEDECPEAHGKYSTRIYVGEGCWRVKENYDEVKRKIHGS